MSRQRRGAGAGPPGGGGGGGGGGGAGAKGAGEAVQVVVRCRPMSGKEANQGHTQIIDMWPQRGECAPGDTDNHYTST